MSERCVCGISAGYPPDHDPWHRRYRRGLAAGAARLGFPADGIVRVSPDRFAQWRVAHELARHLAREVGFDGPELSSTQADVPDAPVVHLALVGRRAVGLAVSEMAAPVCRWTPAPLDDYDTAMATWRPASEGESARVSVVALWVAADRRGRGIGAALVGQLCGYWRVDVEELAWCFPLTDAGLALVTRLQPGRQLVGTNSVDPLLRLRERRLGIDLSG